MGYNGIINTPHFTPPLIHFAPSYRSLAVRELGAVAARAESLKEEKYIGLLPTHEFAPIAMETNIRSIRPMDFDPCEGAREEGEEPDRRREGNHIPDAAFGNCCSAGKRNLHLRGPGQPTPPLNILCKLTFLFFFFLFLQLT